MGLSGTVRCLSETFRLTFLSALTMAVSSPSASCPDDVILSFSIHIRISAGSSTGPVLRLRTLPRRSKCVTGMTPSMLGCRELVQRGRERVTLVLVISVGKDKAFMMYALRWGMGYHKKQIKEKSYVNFILLIGHPMRTWGEAHKS